MDFLYLLRPWTNIQQHLSRQIRVASVSSRFSDVKKATEIEEEFVIEGSAWKKVCKEHWIASKIWIFHSSPTECFFAIGKCAHLDRLAVADCIDIRQPHLIPKFSALGASLHVNEHDHAVSRSDKPLWFAASLCPRGT